MLIKECAAGFILGLFIACESHFSGRCVRVGDLYRNTREELQVSVGVPVTACHTGNIIWTCIVDSFHIFQNGLGSIGVLQKSQKVNVFASTLNQH